MLKHAVSLLVALTASAASVPASAEPVVVKKTLYGREGAVDLRLGNSGPRDRLIVAPAARDTRIVDVIVRFSDGHRRRLRPHDGRVAVRGAATGLRVHFVNRGRLTGGVVVTEPARL